METSGGNWYGDYTVESVADGVRAEKGLDLETLPLPAIKLRVESRRDVPVGVVLEDRVPDFASVHDVGFHDEYGAADWHVFADGRLRWTRALSPGETTVTLYGLWLSAPENTYEVFDPVTVDRVRSLPEGEGWAPRLDGREIPKHSVDEALETERFEAVDALRTKVAVALSGGGAPRKERDGLDVPRPAAEGPAIERAGDVDLDPPAPTAIHALDDPTATRERLFVRLLIRDGTAPVVAESVSTAGRVLGRRIRGHRSGHDLYEAVLATARSPATLATTLADREVVGGALVAVVDEAMPNAPDDVRSMTEFTLLQREFEPGSTESVDADLESTLAEGTGLSEFLEDDPLESSSGRLADDEGSRTGDRHEDGGSEDSSAVEALRCEVDRLRRRVATLEAEVERLRSDRTEDSDDESGGERDRGRSERPAPEASVGHTSR